MRVSYRRVVALLAETVGETAAHDTLRPLLSDRQRRALDSRAR